MHRNILSTILTVALSVHALGATVTWISSTAGQPWQHMPEPSLGPGSPDAPPQVRVAPRKTYQTIDGFGGCFNELGWVALGKASQTPPGRGKPPRRSRPSWAASAASKPTSSMAANG